MGLVASLPPVFCMKADMLAKLDLSRSNSKCQQAFDGLRLAIRVGSANPW